MNFASVYTFGCGQIHYSDHALDEIGPALKLHGRKILMVAGKTAFSVAGERILKSLYGARLDVCQYTFSGECSRNNTEMLTKAAGDFGADVILAVGGGKCADACKIAANQLRIHSAMVPTTAATCAPYVPGSVIYTDDHRPDGGAAKYYDNIGIFMDASILAQAPARYLAAGMADALAKYYELYPTGMRAVNASTEGNDYISTALTGFHLAAVTRELYESRGIQAYRDCRAGILSSDLSNVIFSNIVITGVISGFSRGTGQLQVAHHFHNSLKKHFPAQMHHYLHGELVGTGILVQMICNRNTAEELAHVRNWLQQLSIPVKLADYGVTVTADMAETFVNELLQILPGGETPENEALLRSAVAEVL